MTSKTKIDYSIIIPVYCNADTINELFNQIYNNVICKNKNLIGEIVFIDDGSIDSSLKELLKIKEKYSSLIKIIKFTRNFGQLSAIKAGYKFTDSKCVITLSADLQDPPDLINQMLNEFFNNLFDIVICTRKERDETFFRKVTSKLFYKLIKKINFSKMPEGGFDYVLISDKVKKIILSENDPNSFWQGQILWTGYNIKFIPYKREKRKLGKSKWTFSKKIKYLIDGVLSYSYLPLRAMSVFGFLISFLGFFYAIFIIFSRIFGGILIKGWAPIMIIVLFLSGFQMLMLGIIGEYLWRVLDQVRNRKHYIIEKIYDND